MAKNYEAKWLCLDCDDSLELNQSPTDTDHQKNHVWDIYQFCEVCNKNYKSWQKAEKCLLFDLDKPAFIETAIVDLQLALYDFEGAANES